MSRWLRFLPVVVVLVLIGAFVWRLANPPDSTVIVCIQWRVSSGYETKSRPTAPNNWFMIM